MKVGAFEYDAQTMQLTGPAEFLQSADYEHVFAQIRDGGDPCGAFTYSPDPVTALLVTLQTAYAGWLGRRELLRALDGGTR